MSSGLEAPKDFALLSVRIDLTPLGEERLELVLCRAFEYVAAVAAAGGGEEAAEKWAESVHTHAIDFRYAERGDATGEATSWARRLHTYGGPLVLSGGRILGAFPSSQVVQCLAAMTPSDVILIRESKSFSELAAAAKLRELRDQIELQRDRESDR